MSKTVDLVTLPSGKIQLVQDSHKVLIQFNCSCQDALPYCNAVCCRLRPQYNADLKSFEVDKFDHFFMDSPGRMPLPVLAHNNKHCTYLDDDTSSCKVHADKPSTCASWHCSPGGVGNGITHREDGWTLVPQLH